MWYLRTSKRVETLFDVTINRLECNVGASVLGQTVEPTPFPRGPSMPCMALSWKRQCLKYTQAT